MGLKLVRRRGSPHWYIRGTVRGVTVYESTGTRDRMAAEALRIKREAELLDETVYGPRARKTFAEAAIAYMQAGGERRFLAPLIRHFGATRLDDIDQAAVDEAARILYPAATAATRNRQVYTPVSAVISYAAESKWCAPLRLRRPRVETPQRPAAEPHELEAFVAAASPHLGALALFLALTGRRIGEAVRLTWADLDLERAEARIARTKNREPCTVHLPPPLVAALANLDGPKVPTERVFRYASRWSVRSAWRTACMRAGIRYLTPHEMGRHTYATWMRRYAGLDLRALQEAGGWRSIQSVARYAKVTPSETQRAADRLGELFTQRSDHRDRQDTPAPRLRKIRAQDR